MEVGGQRSGVGSLCVPHGARRRKFKSAGLVASLYLLSRFASPFLETGDSTRAPELWGRGAHAGCVFSLEWV